MDTVNSTSNSSGNFTIISVKTDGTLELIVQVLVIGLQIFIMSSMGAIITVQDILTHLKRPFGVLIALTSQFIALPACAYGLINLIQLSPIMSISAMILACCPGGSSSNLFTYFCDGDVPLSIMLTTTSTILALGFMPLNLLIYTRKWTETGNLKVPYAGIATTLAIILVPLAFGMAAKKWAPKLAKVLSKFGSVIGMLLIWIAIVLQCILYPKFFTQSWKHWTIAAAIPTGGFIVGFLLSFILRRPPKQQKTIAIETGMQSISLAITIVVTSFPKELHGVMTPVLVMCGIYLNLAGFFLAFIVRVRNCLSRKTVKITPVTDEKMQTINTVSEKVQDR